MVRSRDNYGCAKGNTGRRLFCWRNLCSCGATGGKPCSLTVRKASAPKSPTSVVPGLRLDGRGAAANCRNFRASRSSDAGTLGYCVWFRRTDSELRKVCIADSRSLSSRWKIQGPVVNVSQICKIAVGGEDGAVCFVRLPRVDLHVKLHPEVAVRAHQCRRIVEAAPAG